MNSNALAAVLAQYGLHKVRLASVEKGYRNQSHHIVTADGKHLNFILYKHEPGIAVRVKRANTVSDYVAHHGLPARKTYGDARLLRVTTTRYGALYEYLPGTTIPWEAYTQAHIKLLGKTMSDMHAVLALLPPHRTDTAAVDEYAAICGHMQAYFSDSGVQTALRQKLGLLLDPGVLLRCLVVLQGCRALPGQQQLHMDFVRGNILFTSPATATLSGILDFEKTAYGHPLFDIARTLAFLLVDCRHKHATKVYKYFILSGYNKRGSSTFKITARNEKLLRELVRLFLLHDFYKFLRHNPYESLPLNSHFMRTCAILLQDVVLTSDDTIEYRQ